jgi:hypothetical protein
MCPASGRQHYTTDLGIELPSILDKTPLSRYDCAIIQGKSDYSRRWAYSNKEQINEQANRDYGRIF